MASSGIRKSANEIGPFDSAQGGPNMTPLVDVVMVILIFLMLTGSFAGSHWFLKAQSTLAGNGPGAATVDPRLFAFDVRIDRSTDGFVARFGDTTITGDGELLKQRLDLRRTQLESIGTKADDVRITLRPTRGVTYEQLIKVYEAALRAKFSHVAFAASAGNVE